MPPEMFIGCEDEKSARKSRQPLGTRRSARLVAQCVSSYFTSAIFSIFLQRTAYFPKIIKKGAAKKGSEKYFQNVCILQNLFENLLTENVDGKNSFFWQSVHILPILLCM